MKLKIAVIALALTPSLALACPAHEQRAMSCADGYVWSEQASTCVQQVTG